MLIHQHASRSTYPTVRRAHEQTTDSFREHTRVLRFCERTATRHVMRVSGEAQPLLRTAANAEAGPNDGQNTGHSTPRVKGAYATRTTRSKRTAGRDRTRHAPHTRYLHGVHATKRTPCKPAPGISPPKGFLLMSSKLQCSRWRIGRGTNPEITSCSGPCSTCFLFHEN